MSEHLIDEKPLLQCPFCGNAPELVITLGHEHYVECKKCWSQGAKYLSDSEKAIIAWNRRDLSVISKIYTAGQSLDSPLNDIAIMARRGNRNYSIVFYDNGSPPNIIFEDP